MHSDPFAAPVAAQVRQDNEQDEDALIEKAKQAISTCNWELGRCAAEWTERWAKGRTDEDFGAHLGMSGDQVNQRRRVWERWGARAKYKSLSWSHYYAALTWEDADDLLLWSHKNGATVAQMKAHKAGIDVNKGLTSRDSDMISESPDNGGSGQDSESPDAGRVSRGSSDDPFSVDPFGEGGGSGEDAAGEDGGMDASGTDSKDSTDRPPRNGTEAPVGSSKTKTKAELIREQKAKAIKTLEACSRAIGDLSDLRPSPKRDEAIRSLRKIIATVKEWK